MFGLYTNYAQKSNENIYEYANRITALWHREGRYLEGIQFIRVFIEGLDDTRVKRKMKEWFWKETNPELSNVLEVADEYQDIENDDIPNFEVDENNNDI